MRTITLVLLLCASVAFATPPKKSGDIDVESRSHARASSQSSADVGGIDASGGDSYAEGGHATGTGGNATGGSSDASSVSGDSSAISGDSNVEIEQGDTNFNSESTNTNVVLVPNNNTAGCNRVYGISFGNGDGAGALGVPFRDKSCDYEQAADDAAASGQHKIAWWWRCHKPHLYKTFKNKDETKEQAQLQCWNSMVQMLEVTDANFNEPQLLEEAVVVADWNAEDLVAQLSDEQYEKLKKEIDENEQDHEKVEQRQAQQETLIETQAEQIERLKREAEALRKAEEARRAAEEAVKSKFSERLAKRGTK